MAGPTKPTTSPETRNPRTAEELRAAILSATDEVKEILETAEEAGRELTDAEQQRVEELLLQAEGLNSRLERVKRRTTGSAASSFTSGINAGDISQLFGGGGGSYEPSGKAARGAAWGRAVVRACADESGLRYKGLTGSGSVLVEVPAPDVVAQGRPVAQLRSLIPAQPTDGVFAYLRHDVRENNAAPVAPGQIKPVSVFEVSRQQDHARVIAHLTEPIPRQDLADAPLLQEFVAVELAWGLEQALEAQILTGNGIGENFVGLASTAGTQTVGLVGIADDGYSLIRTLRRAITRLENLGLTGTGFVLSPQDYEAVETAATDDGALMLNGAGQAVPIDRAARRLFGIPVVSTPSCPPGVAWLADWTGSVQLHVRSEATISWSENTYDPDALGVGIGASDFARNLVRMRCESRFGLAVTRPSGVVKINLV